MSKFIFFCMCVCVRVLSFQSVNQISVGYARASHYRVCSSPLGGAQSTRLESMVQSTHGRVILHHNPSCRIKSYELSTQTIYYVLRRKEIVSILIHLRLGQP